VGYRKHNKLVTRGERLTVYSSACDSAKGLASAQKRWPEYDWKLEPWSSRSEDSAKAVQPPKMYFTRTEVWEMILKERAFCARVCEDEERIRSAAGQKHPEESQERSRCFAGARAAINCALGIRSERAKSLEEFECERF
jgi:hypothetical protein